MFQHTSSSYRILSRRWGYGLLSLLFASSMIVTTPQSSQAGKPWGEILQQGVEAIQLSNLTDEQEAALGKQIHQELIKSNKIKLYQNPYINQYINEIGKRLVPYSDRPNLPYSFYVVNDKSINAFATMGGYVYIHTGLIKKASNEAELASVIAHEMGHIAGRHGIKQTRNSAIAQGLLTAAGLDQKTWVQLGVQLAYSLPHSRKDELEADQIGLKNLKSSGYAPSAMISFMKKLLEQERSGSVPAVLSTHPNTNYRIEQLSKSINPSTANAGTGLDQQTYQSRISTLK